MSWVDRVQTDFIITTGDGKQYKPLWKNPTKEIEYFISEFSFPELAGSLVKRGQPKGRKFNLEIYFQGDDHLDTSKAFEVSANDTRAWVITHPMYGSLTVQPTSLAFDNTSFNVSKITGTLIETISDGNPVTTVDPSDNVSLDKENLDSTVLSSFTVTPTSSDINTTQANVNKFYSLGSKITNIASESQAYFNLFNQANAAITNATALPLIAIRAVQSFINYPALFSVGVKTRVDLLSGQFAILRQSIGTIGSDGTLTPTITEKSSKKFYESNGVNLISSMALASANPLETDFGNSNSVLLIIEELIAVYNQYKADLDSMQSLNGGDTTSYIPDANSLIALNSLLNFTVSSLYNIALTSKQERSIILEQDSNLIILTHRFYGLDPFDSNIEELMVNNNIGLNEMLQIKKGRKIIYYI